MRHPKILICSMFVCAALAVTPASCQNSQSYLNDTGSPAYSVKIPVENGFIDISNGNLHMEFPLASPPQRGSLKLSEKLVYDSRIWMFSSFGTHGSYHWWPYNVYGSGTYAGGWRFVTGAETGQISDPEVSYVDNPCYGDPDDPDFDPNGLDIFITSQVSWTDPNGTTHPFNMTTTEEVNSCSFSAGQVDTETVGGDGSATDGSGYLVTTDGNGNFFVVDGNGTQVYPQIIDRYGNYLSTDANGNVMDDTGRVPVIVTQNGNTTTYDVLAPNGNINNNGTRVRYTVTTAAVPVATNFGQSDIYEWDSPQNPGDQPLLTPVQSIQLPDGSQYTFGYDSYGELSSITLPTGGTISYQYTNFVDSSNTANRWLDVRTVGSNPAMVFIPNVVSTCSNYSSGCVENVILRKPSGDETSYQLTLNNGAWNTQVSTYTGPLSGGQELVQTTNTNSYTNGCYSNPQCVGANYLSQQLTTTEVFPNGAQTQPIYSQTNSYFNQYPGKPSEVDSWDYAGSANTATPPSSNPTRKTSYIYTGYDLQSVTVYDSNSNQVAQTTYGYTSNATTTSGITQHGTQNAGGPYLQTVSRWLNTGSPSVSTYTMDDTGQILSVVDPDQHPASTVNYQCANSLPNQETNASGQTTTYGYDCSSGAITSVKDPNDLAAGRPGTVYQYEQAAGRLQSITYPDGGQTNYSYPSATEVDTSVLASPDPTITSQSILDTFGRQYQEVQGGVSSETTYDANGRINCLTNPHLSSASQTDGTACITYDGLDRPTLKTEQDGNQITLAYQGNTVTSTDEAGNSWQRTSDAFGELTKVLEPVVNEGSIGTASPETDYSYDALGNLLTVTQKGIGSEAARNRSFTYDSLSRMLTSTTPEAGTITYGYDANGNLMSTTSPAPNSLQGGGETVVTSYTYDVLNRLTDKQSAGASGVSGFNDSFSYDSPTTGTGGAFSSSNSIGRMVEASNSANASEQYSYDAMGRVVVQANTLPSTCCDAASQTADEVKAQYDLAGNITNLTYPDGRVVTQTYNDLGQLLNSTSANYNGQQENYIYAGGLTYTPTGAQAEITLGNGVYIHTPYNNREQMCQVWSSGPSSLGSPVLVDTHIYYGSEIFCGNTPGNNGNISEVKDWRNQNRTRHFGYDSLNRINSFNTNDNTLQQNYSYDSFGNLTNQTGTLNPSFNVGANNQITNNGYGYDAAGNAISYDNNGTASTLQFNADGEVVNFNSGAATYTYEATGSRARKDSNGAWTEYVNFSGQTLAELHSDGTWSDYIYANGQKIARADNYDVRIHFSGTNCSNCGPQAWAYDIPIAPYVIQSGDKIAWRQYQDGPAVPRGGLAIQFTDGTNTNWSTQDQNGQVMNSDSTQNAWDYRVVDLSAYAGKTISVAWINEDAGSGAGNWDEYFSDIAFYRTDGTIDPIYHRQTNVSYSGWGYPGVTNQQFEINVGTNLQGEMADNTTYYLGDQTGSVREEFGGEGWPVSSSVFYPFGVEQATTTDPNSYKFATLERDSESSLDHATFRQYSPLAGRWMSPDPYNGSYDLSDPQSLNRYTYVIDSPLEMTDPTGQDGCAIAVASVGETGIGLGVGAVVCGLEVITGGAITNALFGWLFGHASFHGSVTSRPSVPDMPQGTGTPDWGGPILNETLGLPAGGPGLPNTGIAGALGLPSNSGCEFGACGGGPGSFQSGALALPTAGGIAICAAAEPCGTIALGVAALASVITAGAVVHAKAHATEVPGELDCAAEWEEAREVCRRLIADPRSPPSLQGSKGGRKYTNVEDCARGWVTEACGGNPIDWGHSSKIDW